jgi:23S rRNA (adenine2503-C2)-methyltransferase
MLYEINRRNFSNGVVYALKTEDGFPIETTDTFLPFYTKDCIHAGSNKLNNADLGSRDERWLRRFMYERMSCWM